MAKQPTVPTDPSASSVPFFTQAETFEQLWPQVRRHIVEVFDQGEFSQGAKVAEFEQAIVDYTGARHAVAVNNGTDALTLLLRSAGIGPGDEVIVPAFSFVASASSVALCGATPVFADIEPRSYSLDASSAASAITPRTRALMPVHLFNQMADMSALSELATRRGLLVIEDSAEAIGMRWNGVHAGLLGVGGVLSFFPTKTLGALGDAGMVLTNDDLVADRARALRNHGRQRRWGRSEAVVSGANSKMDEVQASILLAKIGRLDSDIARREALAAAYSQRLASIPEVRTPTLVPRKAETNPVFYVYLIEAERRDGLERHLHEHHIGSEVYYPRPLHQQPCFRSVLRSVGDLRSAEQACASTIALPLYPDLTIDDLDRVCGTIADFYGRSGS